MTIDLLCIPVSASNTSITVEAGILQTVVNREVLSRSDSLNPIVSLESFLSKHIFYRILFLSWEIEGFIKDVFIRERHNATESEHLEGKSCPLQWL